jgi:hypothetical protein
MLPKLRPRLPAALDLLLWKDAGAASRLLVRGIDADHFARAKGFAFLDVAGKLSATAGWVAAATAPRSPHSRLMSTNSLLTRHASEARY